VPIRNRDDAARVAAFFTARIENNLDAYTAVVPDDEPISLFGKDSFLKRAAHRCAEAIDFFYGIISS
jgi:hypothetical protein